MTDTDLEGTAGPEVSLAELIDLALSEAGLRAYVDAIEPNVATEGEVVLWRGAGHPVYSVEEALRLAEQFREAEEAE